MKTYTIKTPYITVTRKRRDWAVCHFLQEAWNALHASGQLDTKAGKALYAKCEVMAADVRSGAYIFFSFSDVLPHGAGNISFECNP